jgi:hypothetical protein
MKWLVILVVFCLSDPSASAQPRQMAGQEGPTSAFSQILGRPTDHTVAISVLSATTIEAFIEYGTAPREYPKKTPARMVKAGEPMEFELAGLEPNAKYFYRVRTKAPGAGEFAVRDEGTFRTQRTRGETFTFGVQGDSHPERLGKMYDPDLYIQTMTLVAGEAPPPDFYFLMGDDFSIERLIERQTLSQPAVDAIYAHQRGFLGLIGKSTPLMLVNGNHEQAAKYLLDGTANNFAVFAGRARTRFYPLPAPGGIYTGNAEPVEHVGLLRDYYAWEWGDALFVVIDPYWHSDVAVDNEAGTKAPQRDTGRGGEPRQPGEDNRDAKRRARQTEGGGNQPAGDQPANRQGKGNRDLWQVTLGNAQYQWLSKTLHESKAKFKFVFSHHVLGTGRGGVEVAGQFEWGGQDRRGLDRFFQMRPTWKQPIHDLMRDTGVTIFFQGHDHLYARQELDGVIYQTVPNPADSTFAAFNAQAYKSGDILPNSGHLRVTVSPESAKVEYVRSFRPQDEGEGRTNGSIAHSYIVKPREPAPSKPMEPKR